MDETSPILKAYDAGHPTHAISALYDMKHFDLLELLRRNGRDVSRDHIRAVKNIRHESVQIALEVCCHLRSGKSMSETSRIMDLSPGTIKYISNDMEIAESRAGKRKPPEPDAPIQRATINNKDDVLAFTAECLQLDPDIIASSKRTKVLRDARLVIAYLLDRYGLATRRECGELLGHKFGGGVGRHLTTRSRELYEKDRKFREDVDYVTRYIKNKLGERKII